MSYLWSFTSYDPQAYARLLGGGGELSEDAARAVLGWDGFALGTPEVVGQLAVHVAQSGLSYEGLTALSARELDAAVSALFSPEGLEEELGLEYESPDGVHTSVLEELVARCAGDGRAAPLLSVLAGGGRRVGARGPSPERCEYCLLSPQEVELLLDEAEGAWKAAREWSAPHLPDLVEECLLGVLREVLSKEKALIALLG